MRVFVALVGLGLLPLAGAAQGRYDRATNIGAVDSVWSSVLDEQRPYLVYTPPSYDETVSTPQHYPVLYLLDGDDHFHAVSGLVQILATGVNYTYAIPEMIVVAIPNVNRLLDLTPTRAARGPNGEPNPPDLEIGGNPDFFRFLNEELIPHIESRYRTMPYRILVGHSLGGITAINALYQIPETFDAYVAIDPSLWWDDELLVRQAKDYFLSRELGGKALYVAQANTIQPDDPGSIDDFVAITQFDAVVRSHNESGMRYGFRYYHDDDHGSVALIAEYDALRFIFEGYRLPLERILAEPPMLTEHFRSISERLGKTFLPPESLVRLFAGAALGDDNVNAIAFGEIRTQLYPESYRAHEFLGDVWAAEGDTEKAADHYERALERDPGNTRVTEKLRELSRQFETPEQP